MKKIILLLLFVPVFINAQPLKSISHRDWYCSELVGSSRWCFSFDSVGKVHGELGGRSRNAVNEDFLPTGFTTSYTELNDTIRFTVFVEDFGKEVPVAYRYNNFTGIIKEGDIDLWLDGRTSTGATRQQKFLLRKTAIVKSFK